MNNKVDSSWQGLIPFIIEDVTPRQERLPQMREHENGVTGIHAISLATADLARYTGVMAAVLDTEEQAIEDDTNGAVGVRLDVGGHRLEYLAPSAVDSPVGSHLAAHRAAPYAVSFKTTNEARRFSPDETVGVRISLV